MKNRRGWIIAPALVLIALLGACSFTPGTLENNRIYLTVGSSSEARLIGVEEFNVESLDLQIFDPEGDLLWSETWEKDDGLTVYAVEVGMQGTHEIVVVHNMEEGTDPAEVEEREFFDISCMLVTVINITPGAIGMVIVDDGGDCTLTGGWEGTIPFPDYSPDTDTWTAYYFPVEFRFNGDGTAELYGWESEADKAAGIYLDNLTKSGTYEYIPDEVVGLWTHESEDAVTWVELDEPISWGCGEVTFSGDCNTLSFSLIIDGEDTGLVWELTRM